METKSGLLVGIDIQEQYAQACYFDRTNRMPQNVLFGDGRHELENPVPLSEWTDVFSQGIFSKTEEIAAHIAHLIGQAMQVSGCAQIDKICISVQYFQENLLDAIASVMEKLSYEKSKWIAASHEECYAYYAYSQKRDLYQLGVMLLDYEADGIHAYMMRDSKQNGTNLIREGSSLLGNERVADAYAGKMGLDEIEAEIVSWLKGLFAEQAVSSVYLTGKGFNVENYPDGLTKFLCAHRKVFAGQNLFVKGACFCAYESTESSVFDSVLLACHNRVTTGIEVNIQERAVTKRLRIVKPGTNWYMAQRKLDFILEDVRKISLIMKPCDGSGDYEELIDISEIPYRPGKMTRISMEFKFSADDRCTVTVRDKGFGEFIKSSGKSVCRELSL